MKSVFALLLACLLATPAFAAAPSAPDFKGMSVEELKSYYDEGAFTTYRDAVKELIDRGELEVVRKNLRDPNPNRDHYMTAWAVAWMHSPGFVDDMALLLEDLDPGVRYYAVYYLMGLHKDAYGDRIARLLTDPASVVRGMAVIYLGEMKLVAHREAVAKLATDPDPEVRTKVQDALKKLQ